MLTSVVHLFYLRRNGMNLARRRVKNISRRALIFTSRGAGSGWKDLAMAEALAARARLKVVG